METSWWQVALITLAIALVAGVILLVLEHRSPWFARFQESVRRKVVLPEGEYRIHPTPDEIVGEIANLPVFQQKAAGQNYTRLHVRWPATFYSIIPHQGNVGFLVMLRYLGGYPWVYCNHVDIQKYPEFKIMKEQERLWVAGEISGVDGNTIILSKCVFRFK